MKPRAYVTRFGRIMSGSNLPDEYKINIEDCEKTDSPIGPVVRRFYSETLSVGLSVTNHFGNMLLYPLRETEIYVLTINGKSNFYSSNQKLYQTLFQKGFITQSDYTKSLFKEYRLLDLKEIAKHITDSQILEISADDDFIRGSDVSYIKYPTFPNHISVIPCVFENKIFFEVFLKTSTLTDEIIEKLKEHKLRKFTSCFNTPWEVIGEISENLNF